jgi:hypothetical protein
MFESWSTTKIFPEAAANPLKCTHDVMLAPLL